MTLDKLDRLRRRCWINMFRIALKYPKNCKRRVFAKWSNRLTKLNKTLRKQQLKTRIK